MGRDERDGVGDNKNEMGMENGKWKPKPKRENMVYIYYQNDAPLPLGSQVIFFLIYIYIKAVSGFKRL